MKGGMEFTIPPDKVLDYHFYGMNEEEIVQVSLRDRGAEDGKYRWFWNPDRGLMVSGKSFVEITIERFEKAGATTFRQGE